MSVLVLYIKNVKDVAMSYEKAKRKRKMYGKEGGPAKIKIILF